MKSSINILLAFLVLSQFSCKKSNSSDCEKWSYEDKCTPKNIYTKCAGDSGPTVGNICGDQLKDAKAGRTSIRHESADAKITRHYIMKIN